MSDAIIVKGVTKTFGPKVAVREFDLVVPEKGLYGFIGPNGAGKTTTIRLIMSILFPDRGELSILGCRSALDAKDRIGYLPEERGVHKKMKVGAFLVYMARLKGQRGPDVANKVRHWLERVGLGEVEKKRCEELSKGMLQKVQFVSTVIHEPDLLILDEPFSGLDPVNMRLLRDLVLDEHKRGATVIFSTHVMSQAEQICDHIVMINNGDKVIDDSLTDIQTQFDPRTILFEPMEPEMDMSSLNRIPGVASVSLANGTYEIGLVDGSDAASAMREIVNSIAPSRVQLNRPTLEDIFISIVHDSAAAGDDEIASLRASLRATSPAEVEA